MRKQLVSSDFIVPQHAEFGEYYLVPITTKNVMEDWLVLQESADIIAQVRGAGSRDEWPYHCTLEENYKDLAWLEVCASYRQLFCYILRRKQDDSYVGAIYIYPIELFQAHMVDKYDVDFSFWVTKQEYARGTYEAIFKGFFNWLIQDWHFPKEKIYLRNKEVPQSLSNFV